MSRDEYERLLRSDQNGFHAVVDFKEQYIPPSIFKFREASDLNLQVLRECKVWLSAPKHFNDLYDSAATGRQGYCFDIFLRKNLHTRLFECGLMKWLAEEDVVDLETHESPFIHLGHCLAKRQSLGSFVCRLS